ncbi:MAG: hypothetical protein MMC23_005958 [Stictis urceolatum]|nr:hypothetical protein [Stictis urceolata]
MWQQDAEGNYTRPIGEMELLVWLISASKFAIGRDEWHLTAAATFRLGSTTTVPQDLIDRFRLAWQQLRFESPNIAAAVVDGGKTIRYQSPTAEGAVESWMKQTFVVENEKSKDVEAFVSDLRPIDMLQCHVFPHTGEILLQTSHWRTDGRGILILLNRLLDLAAQEEDFPSLNWGRETERLLPSLEDASELPHELDPEDFKFFKSKAEDILKSTPVMTIPSLGDHKPVEVSRRLRLQLSESETSSIIAACKTRGVSITSAVHAALAQTNMRFSDAETRQYPYRSSFRRDTRSNLLEKYRGEKFAAALCHVAIPTDVPNGASYDSCLQELDQEYKSGVTPQLNRGRRVYYQYINDRLLSPGFKGGARACDVDISSIGIIDNLLQPSRPFGKEETRQSLEITDVTISPAMFSSQCCSMVWTFRGQMTLYLLYNDAYHTVEEIQEIGNSIKAELMKGLRIG